MRAKSKGAAYWSQQLAAIEATGLSTAEYARREGLSINQIHKWRTRLRNGPVGVTQSTAVGMRPAVTRSRFVALHVREAEGHASAIGPSPAGIQVFAGRVRLELPALPAPQWVAALSWALQAEVG